MADKLTINYESINTFADSLFNQSSLKTPSVIDESRQDTESTIIGNANAHSTYEDDYIKMMNIANRGVQEKRNLNTLAEKFKETDGNCSKK